MTNESDETALWPPALFTSQLQQASEEALEQQSELFRQMLSAGTGATADGFSQLRAMSMGAATFKTRVQSGGRISIPDAEREALDIGEGDIVQTIVIPIKRTHGDTNE